MKSKAARFADRCIDEVGAKRLEIFLKNLQQNNLAIPYSFDLILPFIAERVREKALEHHQMADRILNSFHGTLLENGKKR
jgi:hypothetical protein